MSLDALQDREKKGRAGGVVVWGESGNQWRNKRKKRCFRTKTIRINVEKRVVNQIRGKCHEAVVILDVTASLQ